MDFSVEIAFAPANELIVSFYTFLCTKAHKRLELGPTWVSETMARLPQRFATEIGGLGYWDDWGQLQLLARQSPQQETSAQFLRWLEDLSAGEMFERLSPWVKNFPEDLTALRDRVCYFLAEWDHYYFASLSPVVLSQLAADAVEKRQLLPRLGAMELIEQATNGLRFEQVEPAHTFLLSPQYHSQPVTLLHSYDGITICQYSSTRLPLHEPDEPSPTLYRIARSLADKTRLKILYYLKSGPKSFIEIVKHMQMAKSTIYEHTLNLRAAGLIRGNVVGSTVVSYSLREEAIAMLGAQLQTYLLDATLGND